MKTNLFSRFRNLFRRAEDEYDYDEYDEYSEEYSDESVAQGGGEGELSAEHPAAAAASGSSLVLPSGASAPQAEPKGRGVHVPLAPIVSGMPLELQSRVLHEVGDISIFLSVETILPQLSTGAVSVSFGELRNAASHIFNGDRDQDEAAINIPLSAILPYISPDMLARKHGPLEMDIPEDIVSPFEGKGKGLAIGPVGNTPPARTPAPKPAPMSLPAPAPKVPTPRPVAPPSYESPRSISSQAAPVSRPVIPQPPSMPLAMPRATANKTSQPAAPVKPASSIRLGASSSPTPATHGAPLPSMTQNGTRILPRPGVSMPPTPKPAQPTVATPAAPTPVIPGPATASVPAAQAARPAKVAPPAPAAPQVTQAPLVIALSSVADVWPDGLKQEIIQLNLAQARLELPFQMVEAGLKRGRLSFPWAQVRSWINPEPQVAASIHDAIELELPLRIVAPLFVAQKKDQPEKSSKVAVDKDIPNLFFGLPQPDTAGVAVDHAVNKPLDTNYYVWDDEADSVPDDEANEVVAHVPTAATEFVTRYATPNEVVSRAESFDGVEGAVIALPDGLMVASKLPSGLNGDTLAAFLPQLFGKVTQCTQELRMGQLNNLNFTVGNVPWKIFRVNALYFAAFGAMGQPMPTAKLAALAAELDHKAKV